MPSSRNLPPLHTLVAFEAVARLGSFTAAATRLHLTQSAVSKQVQMLEERLRTPLFKRHARGVSLTQAGDALLESLEPALQRMASGIERVRQLHDQTRISLVATQAVAHYWLFPRITAFNRLHPQITINIHSNNALADLSVEDYDFILLYGRGDWTHLHADPLFAERIYPVARPGLIRQPPKSAAEVAELPLIQLDTREWDCIDWPLWFAHFGETYDLPEEALTFNQVTLVYQAVKEGMGVGLGWDFMVRAALNRGELEAVGDFVLETGKADYLAYSKSKPLKPAAQVFRDWLLDEKQKTPDESGV